jgi:hypothetical protein
MQISLRTLNVRLATMTLLAMAQPGAGRAQSVSTMPIEDLKTAYLDCERSALAGNLGKDSTMECSIYYETLKNRAFGGSFNRLKEWYDKQLRLQEAAR